MFLLGLTLGVVLGRGGLTASGGRPGILSGTILRWRTSLWLGSGQLLAGFFFGDDLVGRLVVGFELIDQLHIRNHGLVFTFNSFHLLPQREVFSF